MCEATRPMYHLYDIETDEGAVTAIGVLPPEVVSEKGLPSPAMVGTIPRASREITAANFVPNAEFSNFLGFVISKHGADDPTLANQASQQVNGWVFMVDLRIGETEDEIQTEDVLGAFRAENGCVVEGSYRANPKHALLTERGLPVLDEWIYERLVHELLELG